MIKEYNKEIYERDSKTESHSISDLRKKKCRN
jgi:hypothetical protein